MLCAIISLKQVAAWLQLLVLWLLGVRFWFGYLGPNEPRLETASVALADTELLAKEAKSIF
jgi:hypothetical protein